MFQHYCVLLGSREPIVYLGSPSILVFGGSAQSPVYFSALALGPCPLTVWTFTLIDLICLLFPPFISLFLFSVGTCS
jgi:hypothetical protein